MSTSEQFQLPLDLHYFGVKATEPTRRSSAVPGDQLELGLLEFYLAEGEHSTRVERSAQDAMPMQFRLFDYIDVERLNTLNSNVLNDDAVDFFARGHCASMALALHILTGWPIVGVEWRNGRHAVVDSPLGWFDADGPHARERWSRDSFRFRLKEGFDLDAPDPFEPRAYPLTVDDLLFLTGKNLDLVFPFAQALLERYFSPTTAPMNDDYDYEDHDEPKQRWLWRSDPNRWPWAREFDELSF